MVRTFMRVTSAGVPYLSRKQIDDMAEKMIADFCPAALVTPQPIDIEIFAQQYLGFSQKVSYLSNNGVYLGKFCFMNTLVPVYDPDKNTAEFIPVKANTYMIDEWLLDESQQNRYRFTIGHEAGHGVLHQIYFKRKNHDLYQNDTDLAGVSATARVAPKDVFYREEEGAVQMCRMENMTETGDQENTKREWTDQDRLEWQANAFASACLLPRSAVQLLATEVLKKQKNMEQIDAESSLIRETSSVFQVSEEAAYYRLKGLGLITRKINFHPIMTQEMLYRGAVPVGELAFFDDWCHEEEMQAELERIFGDGSGSAKENNTPSVERTPVYEISCVARLFYHKKRSLFS